MTMPYVYDKPEADKLANAKAQGQAQFDSIREMVEALNKARGEGGEGQDRESYSDDQDRDSYTVDDDAVEAAEQAIHEDALSVEVRSAWVAPGEFSETNKRGWPTLRPVEYRILLCTGGPAVQIVGDLSEHGEPETATMQVQDWFAPWTTYTPWIDGNPDVFKSEEIMLTYARCFYFGE